MMLKEALERYNSKYPFYKADTILDVGDEWVISARDKATNLPLDVSPIAVHKDTGAFRVFFPPMNLEKMEKAVVVDRREIDSI